MTSESLANWGFFFQSSDSHIKHLSGPQWQFPYVYNRNDDDNDDDDGISFEDRQLGLNLSSIN